jgi:hypothetical protein
LRFRAPKRAPKLRLIFRGFFLSRRYVGCSVKTRNPARRRRWTRSAARRTARGSTACSACTSSARWRCWGWRADDILASALGQDPAIAAEAPVTATSGVTALCHPAVCMGSRGAALSNAVSYALNLVLLPLYVRLSGACRATWNGFSRDGLTELGRFTQLAVPSAMMIWSHRNCNFL